MGPLGGFLSGAILGLNERKPGQERSRKVAVETPLDRRIHLQVQRTGVTSWGSGRKSRDSSTISAQVTSAYPRRSNERRSPCNLPRPKTQSHRSSPSPPDN